MNLEGVVKHFLDTNLLGWDSREEGMEAVVKVYQFKDSKTSKGKGLLELRPDLFPEGKKEAKAKQKRIVKTSKEEIEKHHVTVEKENKAKSMHQSWVAGGCKCVLDVISLSLSLSLYTPLL